MVGHANRYQGKIQRLAEAIFTAALQIATIMLLPLLVAQGFYVRRRIPRLPEATGPLQGRIKRWGPQIELVAVGESTVAGVGAADHRRALTGQLAEALATATESSVAWRAVGRNGLTAATMRSTLVPQLGDFRADIIVIALGVNDVLAGHTPGRWQRDMQELIGALRQKLGNAAVFIAAMPPIGHFPALPVPLRWLLGWRAKMLERRTKRLANCLPGVDYVSTRFSEGRDYFASDGFHPSTAGYAAWGAAIAAAIADSIRAPGAQK